MREGDLIHTADNGLQPPRWIGLCRQSTEDLARNPVMRPIHIGRGALGMGSPA
ncbi:Hint domain-containing protein [Paracoccus sp. ME4]|uniref:Hint domain-containing protein n=1 Tax=Paracoccus sp. ME4 TaxID=3138066 RepID=UPI00398AA8CC